MVQINPRAAQIFNINGKDWIGKPLLEIDHPLIAGILGVEINDNRIINGQGLEQYKCEVAEFIDRGFKRRFIQLQELSKELLAAEKRAYGKVIRMMAHEVNNSIGAINSILGSAVDYLEDSQEEESDLMKEALQTAVNRNQGLNIFMRNFANVVRLPPAKRTLNDLAKIALEVGQLMRPRASELDILLRLDIPEGETFNAFVDVEQLEQALVNIVKNAIEAIGNDGTIIIQLKSNPLEIIVRNNGKPIPPEIEDQLFTPFFSTKSDGQGVGLTLVREIVMNHNARITLKTGEDNWTVCSIRF